MQRKLLIWGTIWLVGLFSSSLVADTDIDTNYIDPNEIEPCFILIPQMRPLWSEEMVDLIRTDIFTRVRHIEKSENSSQKLKTLQQEFVFLLDGMPNQLNSTEQQKYISAEIRWFVENYLRRETRSEEQMAIQRTQIENQLVAILDRMTVNLRKLIPTVPKAQFLLASDRCRLKCMELADRQLAPVLKEVMPRETVDKLWAAWNQQVENQLRNMPDFTEEAASYNLDMLYAGLLGEIWKNVQKPVYLEDAGRVWQQYKIQKEKRVDEFYESEAAIHAAFGTRLEFIEHWETLLSLALYNIPNEKIESSLYHE